MSRVIRRSRWLLLRWIVFLLISGGVLALCFVTFKLDFMIHRQTQKALNQRFVDALVTITDAHFEKGSGIELSWFELCANDTPENLNDFPPVLEAERVLLECPTQLQELAQKKEIPISTIIFDSATIHTYRRPDGTWSLAALKTGGKKSSFPPPVIQFRNTTIELHDMMDVQQERKLVLRNVEMTIETSRKTFQNAWGKTILKPDGTEKELTAFPFHGTAESEFARSIEFSGNFYPAEGEILVDVEIGGLQYSEDFRNSIPLEIAERFQELRYIRGQIDTHVKVAANLKNFNSASFRLDGRMTDGRSQDPRFPKLVSSLTTDFQISNDGFLFPNLNIRHGNGTLNLDVTQRGYGPASQRKIISKIRKIELSEGLFESLPKDLGEFIRALSPTGQFDMDAEFLFDGRFWSTTGRIVCSNIAINYVKFPYRVEELQGEILLKGNQVQFDFHTANNLIRIFGGFTANSKQKPQPPSGTIQVNAQNVPVDEHLLAACPKNTADFIRTLELGGNINFQVLYRFVLIPEKPETHTNITIDLQKNACRFRDFPYPLRDLEGRIQIDDQSITTEKIRGVNGNAEVELSFSAQLPETLFTPVPASVVSSSAAASLEAFQTPDVTNQAEKLSVQHIAVGKKPVSLKISLIGTNVTLDDDLYTNLPPQAAEIFRYIQPSGVVNIHYEYQSPEFSGSSISATIPGNLLMAAPLNTPSRGHMVLGIRTVGKGTRIALPEMHYWLENFQGSLQFQDGQITLTDFSASHGTTHFSGRAFGTVESIDQWSCKFGNIRIDGLRLDGDLLAVIPAEARTLIAAKRPDGALYYSGGIEIHYDKRTEKPFSLDWNGEFGVVDGSVDFGVPCTAINGGIQLCGHLDQNSFYCGGELNIESLFQQNLQFTKIQGPLWIDKRQILLGGDADSLLEQRLNFRVPEKKNTTSRSLSAHFVGGDLYGTFSMQFGFPSSFQSHIVLTNGFLENCSHLTGNDELKGKMFGEMTLIGTDSSMHTLHGKGEFHLIDADIYKLSVMASLLKILSLKEVNNTGFSSSDMNFHIEGNHIYFDKIDFYGDAFSLIGKGEMDFKRQIKLVFYSVMGRNDKKIPILSPLLHATGRQMLLITMKGPVQNPQITQQPLPGLNMAIQQMENDFSPANNQNSKQ